MKLPLHTIIGPFMKDHSKFLNSVCMPCLYGSNAYVFLISLISLGWIAKDYTDLVYYNVIPASIIDIHNNDRHEICPKARKGIKLMSNGFQLMIFLSLACGAIRDSPAYLVPFVVTEALNTMMYLLHLLISATKRIFHVKSWLLLGTLLYTF